MIPKDTPMVWCVFNSHVSRHCDTTNTYHHIMSQPPGPHNLKTKIPAQQVQLSACAATCRLEGWSYVPCAYLEAMNEEKPGAPFLKQGSYDSYPDPPHLHVDRDQKWSKSNQILALEMIFRSADLQLFAGYWRSPQTLAIVTLWQWKTWLRQW